MSLATDCISILGGSAPSGTMSAELGWDASNENVVFITANTLLQYGVSAEGDITDNLKARGLLEIETWKQVLAVLTNAIDFSADNASFRMSQMREAAERRYEMALANGSRYLPSSSLDTSNIDFGLDPYLRDS